MITLWYTSSQNYSFTSYGEGNPMAEEQERNLAWTKVEKAETELTDYLGSVQYDLAVHRQLVDAIKAAHEQLLKCVAKPFGHM